jgi:DMSO/TMAO reductase YedYZ heme-binding membrane subunit
VFSYLKFWRASGDRFFLFLLLCVACWLLALERVVLLFVRAATGDGDVAGPTEATVWIYLIGLAAFAVIIFAVIGKNRASRRT